MKKKLEPRPRVAAPVSAPEVDASEAVDVEPRLVRLNKFLADHGVASRRRCDELIAEGKVMVDGEPTRELGLKIDVERAVVEVDGFVFKARVARKRYYVLNKPSGVVCTNEARETRPRAVDLITDPFKGRIYTVGRLDEESKGLIVLTNDGDFAHRIQHPRYGVEKTYLVRVAGEIDDKTLTEIREGVHLSEGRTAGARIVVLERGRDFSLLSISIREGMNREIRRVFARYGFKVSDLKRIKIGTLTDRGLKPGRWRELLSGEVASLLSGERAPERGPARGARDAERARPPERTSRGGVRRPRGEAPISRPKLKKRGYARHLVQGGRAVARRPDAPPRFGEREDAPKRVGSGGSTGGGGRSGSDRRGGAVHGRTASRPAAPAARPAGGRGPKHVKKARPGAARGPKPKVGRTQRGGR